MSLISLVVMSHSEMLLCEGEGEGEGEGEDKGESGSNDDEVK